MNLVQIQFSPWDKVYNFSSNLNLNLGDKVVVQTEIGIEIGCVVGLLGEMIEKKDEELNDGEKKIKPILHIAAKHELDKMPKESDKQEALAFAKKAKAQHDLPMKFIDVHFSYDSSRITFAFIADGRVDFREMVKDLTRHFNRTVRLQQIGIRDEAKLMGDFGPCGKQLCCQKYLKELSSITSEMADLQQCAHRGSDRISGICGRLMCCLAYEQKGYEELAAKMPPIGAKVNVDGQRGVVVSHNTLKQSVMVEFKGDKEGDKVFTEVDLNRNKKK